MGISVLSVEKKFKQMENKKVELSRSLFSLAQLSMLLAGFLFTTSGVLFSGHVETKSSAINTINGMILQHEAINKGKILSGELNFTYELGDQLEKEWKTLKTWSKLCFFVGLTLTVLSLYLWLERYHKLKKYSL